MSPLMTSMLAQTRNQDRITTATRYATQARQLRGARGGDAVEPAGLPLTLPGMGIRRPRWWSALESEELAGEAHCAHC